MNEVIRKCVEELGKQSPRLDYVRGMLDTLLAMSGTPIIITTPPTKGSSVDITSKPMDEGDIIDANTRATLATIKDTLVIE